MATVQRDHGPGVSARLQGAALFKKHPNNPIRKQILIRIVNLSSGWGFTLTCTAGSRFTETKPRRWCGSCRTEGCWEPQRT